MLTNRAILSVAALLWGFLQAPFDHIHPEDLDHPVTNSPVHMHFHVDRPDEGPEIEAHTADDDEIDVLWTVVSTPHFVLHPDAALNGWLPFPQVSYVSAVELAPQHRGHDPPASASLIPRAPPA